MSEVPVTGHPGVDAALAALSDLEQTPVADHHERLGRAHATLHDVLQGDGSDDAATTATPTSAAGVPRPPGRTG